MGVKDICILFTVGYPVSVLGFGKEKILSEQFLEKNNNNKIVFWREASEVVNK